MDSYLTLANVYWKNNSDSQLAEKISNDPGDKKRDPGTPNGLTK